MEPSNEINMRGVRESIATTGIKVRLYRKTDKKLFVVEDIPYPKVINGEEWLLASDDKYDVMLYCGKDKNNQDVFAGDIVLKHDGKTKAVVFYNHDMYRFELTPSWYGEAEDAWHPLNIEKIGNIYKNPELLPESK